MQASNQFHFHDVLMQHLQKVHASYIGTTIFTVDYRFGQDRARLSSDMRLLSMALGASLTVLLAAQEPNPTQNKQQSDTPQGNQQNPIFRVQVVSRSVHAVSYRNRSGWTKIDFQGTALAPKAKGSAEVNSRQGYIQVKADMKALPPASSFGVEFLTYVLWAITPDGHSTNLGEALIDGNGNAKLDVTTELQSFGLIVTAEPYFAVAQPSDVVVMENVIRQDTAGKYEEINAKYELLPRGRYVYQVPAGKLQPMRVDKNIPLELYEAQNAVRIARLNNADQYGGSTFQDAVKLQEQAEAYLTRNAGKKPVIMTAREAVQKAEDSRVISIRKQQQLALAKERQDAADREALAKAQAAEAARQQQTAEQQAKLDEARRMEAEKQRLEAEQAKADADAARAQAAAEAQKARLAATEADRLRQQAERDKEALRQQLLQQFNAVLETRETPRGLVVNMSDVLFATGKYALKEVAREKLAKISGIIISHPGLNLQVEGHTDSTGSDDFNQKLSEQRANTVRDYLTGQGIPAQTITAIGLGKDLPVASNDTAAGRQLNRRVEMVVSGEVIGVQIGGPGQATPVPAATSPH
jgi:outer membrane protein OmpA-like peptidoglycan-associated protein